MKTYLLILNFYPMNLNIYINNNEAQQSKANKNDEYQIFRF
jgi:hypothetical protein